MPLRCLTWTIEYDIFNLVYSIVVYLYGGDFMKSKSKSKYYKAMCGRTLFVLGIFFVGYKIASIPKYTVNTINNINGVKSVEAVHIISKYDNRSSKLKVRPVANMTEASIYGPDMPISFTGQMTAYNPICVGCTGMVYCPPRQDVRNGNIYFDDNTYGTIRILAADPAIPCGTIVKVTNISFSKEPIIGIVLDRGGLIKGNIMDFLVSETDDMDIVGRQRNVNYEVLRWGW